jgi:DNA-binding transcriptional LysR family regulator
VGTILQAVYRAGVEDASCGDGTDAAWIGPEETLWYGQLEAWMRRNGHDARCRYRVDSLAGMHAAVRAGAGRAVLPCYLGDGDAALVRVGAPIDELEIGLWILTHPDLRHVARIRAFTAFVGEALRDGGALPAGR